MDNYVGWLARRYRPTATTHGCYCPEEHGKRHDNDDRTDENNRLFGCKTQGNDRSQNKTEYEESEEQHRRMERDTGMIGWRSQLGTTCFNSSMS